MLLKENRTEIEKRLQKNEKTEDELETAKRTLSRVKGEILWARDEGRDNQVIKLQTNLDSAKNKLEIVGLSIEKGKTDLRLFLEKKIDAHMKDFPQRESEYKKNIKDMMAEVGKNLKNALEISKVLPGESGACRSHVEKCLSRVSPDVLQGRADVDIPALAELVAQGVELSLMRNLSKNIITKSYVIDKLYGKATRGDYE